MKRNGKTWKLRVSNEYEKIGSVKKINEHFELLIDGVFWSRSVGSTAFVVISPVTRHSGIVEISFRFKLFVTIIAMKSGKLLK